MGWFSSPALLRLSLISPPSFTSLRLMFGNSTLAVKMMERRTKTQMTSAVKMFSRLEFTQGPSILVIAEQQQEDRGAREQYPASVSTPSVRRPRGTPGTRISAAATTMHVKAVIAHDSRRRQPGGRPQKETNHPWS